MIVIMVGAYTRLTDAGLGCPDWPGCYGHMFMNSQGHTVDAISKAWTEMIHRYIAGGLGFIIFFLWLKTSVDIKGAGLRRALVATVLFQALLGMWTVTWKLHPVVVMAHLLGGFTLFSLLWWQRLRLSTPGYFKPAMGDKIGYALGAVFIMMQIALGGWVSSNYAALACVGFPDCNGLWWPDGLSMRMLADINLPIGANYEGGVLHSGPRMAIHMLHRLGALLIVLLTTVLSLRWYQRYPSLRALIWIFWIVLCLQISLGIINVTYRLPLFNAVAHNAVALCLWSIWLSIGHAIFHQPKIIR